MSAAAMLVVLSVAGSGLDMGRAYLAKARLQQACDAGVLAGRVELGRGWDASAHASADALFNANYPDGTYGVHDVAHAYVVDDNKAVTGTASAEMPTSLMRIFGFRQISLAVTCEGKAEMNNADIVFVLDTTTSMKMTNPGDSVTRIAALRQAVISFYHAIEASKSASAQVRYGFVPFGANVNVGGLLKPEWLADRWTYASRVSVTSHGTRGNKGRPDQQIEVPVPGDLVSGVKPTPTYSIVPVESETGTCSTPPSEGFSQVQTNDWSNSRDTPYNPVTGNEEMLVSYKSVTNGTQYTSTNLGNGTCRIARYVYNNYTIYWSLLWVWWPEGDPRRIKEQWRYAPITYDVSPLKNVAADGFLTGTGLLTVPIGNGRARGDRTVAWPGCIEERQTVATPIDGSSGIPAGALDLNIDLVPDPARPETRWGPSLPHLIFMRIGSDRVDFYHNANGIDADWAGVNIGDYRDVITAGYKDPDYKDAQYPDSTVWDRNGDALIGPDEGDSILARCPSPARRLAEIDDAQTLSDYLDGLTLVTSTYHDIGMIWGARLLSGEGLFKAENQASKNGSPITRHLILMTDGKTEIDIGYYGAYGLEPYDHRRQDAAPIQSWRDNAAGQAALQATVEGRFQAICASARRKFTVWVIAFGTSLDSNLTNCATSGSAFQANNAAELNQRFLDIAGRIASLRLTR